jgi:hypothetical protein
MYTSLNISIAPHKFTEIINGGDKVIVLFSDDGTTITKETHQFSTVSNKDVIGFLESGMGIETITIETASGDWENRYELEYDSNINPVTPEEEVPLEETEDPDVE